MKTFMVEAFNNLCKITVADAHMKSTDLKILLCMYVYKIWMTSLRYCDSVFLWYCGHVSRSHDPDDIYLQSSLQSYSLMILSHIV